MIKGAVYLNLDKDISRKEILEEQLLKYGVEASRFAAIESNLQNYVAEPLQTLRLSVPQLSCLVSHLEIIRQNAEKDTVVFEDDIDLSPMSVWPFTFEELDACLPERVGILQMFTFPAPVSNYVRKWYPGMFGTPAYFIRSWYAKQLVESGYRDGRWHISKMSSNYSQPVADSVLYSSSHAYSVILFGIRDVPSNILPNTTYHQTGAAVTQHLLANPPDFEAIKSSLRFIQN